MLVYLDTAAALKILIDEPETRAMRETFHGWQLEGHDIVASYLLRTEMHCAARRRGFAEAQTIDLLLSAVGLIDIERSHLLVASRGEHSLRSADAIHLAAALAVDADLLVTYDHELTSAAEREGLRTASPA